jgi:hypothetical protein
VIDVAVFGGLAVLVAAFVAAMYWFTRDTGTRAAPRERANRPAAPEPPLILSANRDLTQADMDAIRPPASRPHPHHRPFTDILRDSVALDLHELQQRLAAGKNSQP